MDNKLIEWGLDLREIGKVRALLTNDEKGRLLEFEKPATLKSRDVKRLLTNVDKLKSDPYVRDRMGEPDNDPVRCRDWIYRILDKPRTVDLQKIGEDRRRFSAWMVFDIKKSEIYVKRETANAMTGSWGAPPGDMLVQHPTSSSIVTCLDLHIAQAMIKKMVMKATPVCDTRMLSGTDEFKMLDDIQKDFARKITKQPFTILQGPAGTGKTTVMAAVMTAAMAAESAVKCLAPTHKAKNNLKLRVPKEAETATIHSFNKRKAAKLPPTLFIIDEGSMVDVELLGEFAMIVLRDCEAWQICIAGDSGQLSPVGRGECFRKAVDQLKGTGQLFVLEKCYRTSFQELFEAQRCIRNGRIPDPTPGIVDVNVTQSETEVWHNLKAVISAEGAKVQYIAWQNVHVQKINDLVQSQVHNKEECRPFEINDKVVYIGENKGTITTAMFGTVVRIGAFKNSVEWEDGEERSISKNDMQLAYCMTVHKAQGSEFSDVCVVALNIPTMASVLDRRWIYTAATRAKGRLRVISAPGLFPVVAAPVAKQKLTNLNFKRA
jgi:energy-coupling factor transporter ATP-binding protein EcfA2